MKIKNINRAMVARTVLVVFFGGFVFITAHILLQSKVRVASAQTNNYVPGDIVCGAPINKTFSCPFHYGSSTDSIDSATGNHTGSYFQQNVIQLFGPYQTPVAENNLYFATDASAKQLASCLGGTATVSDVNLSGFSQYNALQPTLVFPNGTKINAGSIIGSYEQESGCIQQESGGCADLYNYFCNAIAPGLTTAVAMPPPPPQSCVSTSHFTQSTATVAAAASPYNPTLYGPGPTGYSSDLYQSMSTPPAGTSYNQFAIQEFGSWQNDCSLSPYDPNKVDWYTNVRVWVLDDPSYTISQLNCHCNGSCNFNTNVTPDVVAGNGGCKPLMAPAPGETQTHYGARGLIVQTLANMSATDQKTYLNAYVAQHPDIGSVINQFTSGTIPVTPAIVAAAEYWPGVAPLSSVGGVPPVAPPAGTPPPQTPPSGVSLSSTTAQEGGTLTLTGTFGASGNTVSIITPSYLGGTSAGATIISQSATQIVISLANVAPGSYEALVTTPSGPTTPIPFTVTAPGSPANSPSNPPAGSGNCTSSANASTLLTLQQSLTAIASSLTSSTSLSSDVIATIQAVVSSLAQIVASLLSQNATGCGPYVAPPAPPVASTTVPIVPASATSTNLTFRYLKVDAAKQGWVAFREIDFYDANDNVIKPTSAKASNIEDQSNDAQNAIDGDANTVWNAGETAPANCTIGGGIMYVCGNEMRSAWIIVDLGSARTVSKIRLLVEGWTPGETEALSISNDGQSFSPVGTFTDIDPMWTRVAGEHVLGETPIFGEFGNYHQWLEYPFAGPQQFSGNPTASLTINDASQTTAFPTDNWIMKWSDTNADNVWFTSNLALNDETACRYSYGLPEEEEIQQPIMGSRHQGEVLLQGNYFAPCANGKGLVITYHAGQRATGKAASSTVVIHLKPSPTSVAGKLLSGWYADKLYGSDGATVTTTLTEVGTPPVPFTQPSLGPLPPGITATLSPYSVIPFMERPGITYTSSTDLPFSANVPLTINVGSTVPTGIYEVTLYINKGTANENDVLLPIVVGPNAGYGYPKNDYTATENSSELTQNSSSSLDTVAWCAGQCSSLPTASVLYAPTAAN